MFTLSLSRGRSFETVGCSSKEQCERSTERLRFSNVWCWPLPLTEHFVKVARKSGTRFTFPRTNESRRSVIFFGLGDKRKETQWLDRPSVLWRCPIESIYYVGAFVQPYPDGGCFAKGVCFSFWRVHKQTGSMCRYAKLFCFLRVVRSLQMCSIVDSRSGSWICKLNVLEWC